MRLRVTHLQLPKKNPTDIAICSALGDAVVHHAERCRQGLLLHRCSLRKTDREAGQQ